MENFNSIELYLENGKLAQDWPCRHSLTAGCAYSSHSRYLYGDASPNSVHISKLSVQLQ